MDQWIKNLWNKNKIVFFLLIPVIALILFKDLIFAFLANRVRSEIKNTIETDNELKSNQENLVNESEKHEALADAKNEEIKNNDSDSIPDDWFKKRRPK